MKLYFVRHGESVGNVRQRMEARGQDPGEAYDMSQAGELTELGREQAEKLAARLEGFTFDEIICSPLIRAMTTILPYLKQQELTAEIWPELTEMPGKNHTGTYHVRENLFGDNPVEVPPEMAPCFRVREDEQGRFYPSGVNYPEGQVLVRKACERIMALYDGTNTKVLMVGHGCNGSRVLERLLGIDTVGRFSTPNTSLSLIQQKSNGDFIVRGFGHMPEVPFS